MDPILKKHKLLKLLMPILVLPVASKKSHQDFKKPNLLANKWFLKTIENTSGILPEYYETNTCERNTYFEFMPNGILKLGIFGSDANGNCVLTKARKVKYAFDRSKNQIVINTDDIDEIFRIERLTKQKLIIVMERTQKFHFELRTII